MEESIDEIEDALSKYCTPKLLSIYRKIISDPASFAQCGDLLPPEIMPYFNLQNKAVAAGVPVKVFQDLVKILTVRLVTDPKLDGYGDALTEILNNKLLNRDSSTNKTNLYKYMQDAKKELLPPKYTEAELTNEFLEALKAGGHQVSGRMHCELGGKIDAFVYETESQPAKIIELKLKADFNSITCAMGQLLAYGDSFPNAELYFGTNCDVSNEFKELLSRYNIKTVKLVNGKLEW